jgi:hypothetical protein
MAAYRLLPFAALLAAGVAFAAPIPVRRGDVFVLSDGTRVRALAPDGRSGSTQPDGSIRYPDGTVVRPDPAGGLILQRPDGRTDRIGRGTPSAAGNGIAFPDGTRLRGTGPNGGPARMQADGTVLYPDGTRATHDVRSGETRFVAPDGTERRINRRKGTDNTVRAVPAAGASRPALPPGVDPRYAGALLTLPADALVTAPSAAASAVRTIDPFAGSRPAPKPISR